MGQIEGDANSLIDLLWILSYATPECCWSPFWSHLHFCLQSELTDLTNENHFSPWETSYHTSSVISEPPSIIHLTWGHLHTAPKSPWHLQLGLPATSSPLLEHLPLPCSTVSFFFELLIIICAVALFCFVLSLGIKPRALPLSALGKSSTSEFYFQP